MQVCQQCGRTYPGDSQRFCTKCGSRLVRDERVSSAELTGNVNSAPFADSARNPGTDAPPAQNPAAPDPFAPLSDYNQTVRSYQLDAEAQSSPDEMSSMKTAAFPLPAAGFPPNMAAPEDNRSSARFETSPPTSAPIAPPPLAAGDLMREVNQSFQEFNSPSAPASTPLPSAPAGVAARAPAQKSYKGVIIGVVIGLLLLLGGGAAVLLLVVKPRLEARNRRISSGESSGTTTNPGGENNSAPRQDNSMNGSTSGGVTQPSTDKINSDTGLTQPPETKEFVNAREKLDGDLARHYVEFAFYYPQGWTLNSQAGTKGATNFADLGRKTEGDFILENLAVSWYASQGTVEKDTARFPELVKSFSARLAKNLPNYRLVNEGATRINNLDGYEFRFQGTAQDEQAKPFDYWGRVVFLPPGNEEQKNGVTLLMLANSKAPELKSVEDVGVKGGLPIILNSFRFR